MNKKIRRLIVICILVFGIECGETKCYGIEETQNFLINTTNNEYNNVISVGQYRNRKDLKKVTIEEGITEIHEEAFGSCSNLIDVTLPQTIKYISPYAFWNCNSNITIHGYTGTLAEEFAQNHGYSFENTGYGIETLSEPNTSYGKYSLDEEIIKNNLQEYSDIYNIKNIYNETKVSIISAMQRLSKLKKENLYSLGFVTDTHINGEENNNSECSLNAFTAITQMGVIDMGIIGGDLYSSYNTDYQKGVNYERHAVDKLSNAAVPLMYVKGNHECNIKTGEKNRISNEKLSQIYSSSYDCTKSIDRVYNKNDEDKLYYYTDIEKQNIRICILNSFNGTSEETEFDEEQLKFIAKDMLNFSDKNNPEDWYVLFFIHRYQPSETKNKFVSIVNAFQNGESVAIGNESIKYSNKGKIIALIGGDVHVDTSNYDDGFLYITTTRAFSIEDDIATTNETAFDIFSIDTEKGKIYATRIGRGKDREWNYVDNQFKIENAKYEYNKEKNYVEVTVTTNRKLNIDKPTWSISDDQYTYSKRFYYNQSYNPVFRDEFNNSINYNISVNNISTEQLTINLIYTLNNDNTVLVTANSNLLLEETKPTWNLSCNGYTYEKIYNLNEKYITNFQSKDGKSCNSEIEVNQIDNIAPNIEISLNKNANGSVTIIANSDEQLQDTKTSWVISNDKKKYYKTIYSDYTTVNTSFIDLYGNITQKSIEYNFEENLTSEYQYGKILNCQNEIMIIVNSNIPMQDTKKTWKLSNDNMSYYKTYSENYITTSKFTDINSEIKDIDIEIDEIKKEYIPNIMISYIEEPDGSMTLIVKSSEKLQDTKVTWKLSADRYTYTKTYYDNYYKTTSKFIDIFGNVTPNYDIEINNMKGK